MKSVALKIREIFGERQNKRMHLSNTNVPERKPPKLANQKVQDCKGSKSDGVGYESVF